MSCWSSTRPSSESHLNYVFFNECSSDILIILLLIFLLSALPTASRTNASVYGTGRPSRKRRPCSKILTSICPILEETFRIRRGGGTICLYRNRSTLRTLPGNRRHTASVAASYRSVVIHLDNYYIVFILIDTGPSTRNRVLRGLSASSRGACKFSIGLEASKC